NHTVAVQAGDIVYFEIGSQAGGRNIQNIQYGKIIVTPNTVNAVVAGAYAKKLDSKVAGLVQANYAETDWDAINAIVAEFKAGSYDSVDALVGAYNSAVANIDAIKPDLVKDIRTTLINSMNSLVAGLQSANYTSEAWATITAAKDAFLNAAPSLTTESELNALYEEKVAEIKAVKPYKQTFTFLDYPSKMNANGYTWIEGEVFDTKLYAGTVNDMKEFDTRGKTEHIMFNAELNAGFDLSAPAYYVENWKWFIGYNAGVIIAYRAEVDMKLTINNNYMEEYGTASNGWTSETAFTYYIVRNGELKKIKEVNAPTRDEDFCGECYLKAGDMLYIEFNSTVIDVGTTRNAEAPCGMTAEADSTAFDAELYAEQNNDLAPEVISAINEKKEALESYYATLSESDYSATNWLTLAQYIESFVERSENEVETVSDVEALYSEIKANMEGVKTVAQTAKELQDTLKAYADDLQAEYDKLVEANKYSSENKAALDKALADGKAKILAAKSATLGNQEKIKAIAALKAVEVGSAGLDCASSLATTMVMPLMAIAICLFAKKKND
ncbi:MAG: hypothetical protein IKT32_06840, partial [Clostridia bacterium]|nr:hypothetical protein [Clostridia bacterium]